MSMREAHAAGKVEQVLMAWGVWHVQVGGCLGRLPYVECTKNGRVAYTTAQCKLLYLLKLSRTTWPPKSGNLQPDLGHPCILLNILISINILNIYIEDDPVEPAPYSKN